MSKIGVGDIPRAKQADTGCRAVWTRWHPIAYEVQKIIHSGKLGKIKRFEADLWVENNLDCKLRPDRRLFSRLALADRFTALPDDSRMIDPKLCGGSILDL